MAFGFAADDLASPLMATCPNCGRVSEGDFRFCPYCASPLEPAAPEREQRKTVTVLFCDVTGSTALGESTDPEALRALLARYFERMIAAAGRSEELADALDQARDRYERKGKPCDGTSSAQAAR